MRRAEEDREGGRDAGDPVPRVRLHDRRRDAERGDRPLRARGRGTHGAGERPEAERGAEPEGGDVPVARLQHVRGEAGVERARRREGRRLTEQRDRLGHEHEHDPRGDEPPQPRRHPAGEQRRERDAEAECEAGEARASGASACSTMPVWLAAGADARVGRADAEDERRRVRGGRRRRRPATRRRTSRSLVAVDGAG